MFRLFTVSVEAGNWKVKLSLLVRSFFIVTLSYSDNILDTYFKKLYEAKSIILIINTCVLNLPDKFNYMTIKFIGHISEFLFKHHYIYIIFRIFK